MKLPGWDDTIVALATPPGIGAIGVIRVGGNRTFDIVNGLFPSKDLGKQLSHTLHVGILKDGEKVLDEVVVSLYKAPRSYTGEDVIEISSHGSPFILQQIIDACINKGARLAKPGEFTQRAFLNGKLDTGLFGINIHRASENGTTKIVDQYSAGCQVFASATEYILFMQLCERHKTLYGNDFTYTLIDQRALNREAKKNS